LKYKIITGFNITKLGNHLQKGRQIYKYNVIEILKFMTTAKLKYSQHNAYKLPEEKYFFYFTNIKNIPINSKVLLIYRKRI
jgi:hypothetical protein